MASGDPGPLLDPRALRRISSLELVARRIVEGTFTGLHHSPVPGFSTDFLQHRAYVPGDDPRFLDWKVFGKTDRHYVREYEDDTNLRATLLVDASGSMAYGAGEISKLHYAVRLAAALAYLLVHQNDAVGLVTFDRAVRRLLPPRPGHRQLRNVLQELAALEAGGETSLASTLQDLVPRIPRRGMIVLLTDGFDAVDPLVHALARLRLAGHETILLHVLDREEVEFRFNQWIRFEGLEATSGSLLVDPAQIRQTYLARFAAFEDGLRRGCNDQRIDLVRLVTDQPYDEALSGYLYRRELSR